MDKIPNYKDFLFVCLLFCFWFLHIRPRENMFLRKLVLLKSNVHRLMTCVGISPMGNLGCLPWGKLTVTDSGYPSHGACWLFWCLHNLPNAWHGVMDYRIFNVRKDVDACGCTTGYTDTVRESALKVDTGIKIPCFTRESEYWLWLSTTENQVNRKQEVIHRQVLAHTLWQFWPYSRFLWLNEQKTTTL